MKEMLRRVIQVWGCVLVVLVLACPWAKAQDQETEQAIAEGMRAELQELMPYLEDPMEDVFLINDCIGYQYSERYGLQKLPPGCPDDGGDVPWTSASDGILGVLTEGSIKPFRQIQSKTGYRKAEGTVVLPTEANFQGVDEDGEGGYNYFGLQRFGIVNAEVGLTSWENQYGHDGKKWFVYHHFSGGDHQTHRDGWPSGGIPAGDTVFMRLCVPQDNTLQFDISCSAGDWTNVYYSADGVSGTRYDGSGQQMRRVTSLILQTNSGKLYDTWQDVYIATPSDMHLWGTADTLSTTPPNPPDPRVTISGSHSYYEETIHIDVPVL